MSAAHRHNLLLPLAFGTVFDIDTVPHDAEQDEKVRCTCGRTWASVFPRRPQTWRLITPLSHFHPRCRPDQTLTAPQELPVLMVHGALDDIAPIHLSRRLLAAWEELSTARRPRAKPAIRVCLKARPRGAFC